jgi:two-component system, OmpR family, phosphate regulon sensor histidine kinase PhoR
MKIRSSFRSIFGKMRKKLLLFIVLANSLALLGIFTTQIYWVREAYHLIDEQFSSSVRIAMKGVANQILNYEQHNAEKQHLAIEDSLSTVIPDPHKINLSLLDFKINEEFKCMHVGTDYEYGIIDLKTNKIIAGKYARFTKELMTSSHRIPLVGFENSDDHVLAAYFPDQHSIIIRRLINWIIISVLFALVLVIGFPVSIFVFNRQKRLSDMKADFINNMTHEFKTPIATISLASEMLMKKSILDDPAKMQRYASIIYDENIRLQNHVEQLLSVSLLERGQFRLKKKQVDIHELLKDIVNKFSLTVQERGGELKAHYCAERHLMEVDKSHLTNVITNLLDNANKYSPHHPWIRIGTQSTEEGLIITVEDHGVGISVENQQNIFKNLYRVPTGNIYTVKGFGIGLYYVKTIIEAHGGHIILKSEIDKGSRFDVYLPFDLKSS